MLFDIQNIIFLSLLIQSPNTIKILTKKQKAASFRSSKKSPKRMDRLRKSFRDSFRRRKEHIPEASKPHQWAADESAVRSATCFFPVKYLGCVEVFESRGMQVCEEALKVLRVICIFVISRHFLIITN